MLCLLGSKLANLHYPLLLQQATVYCYLSQLSKRERHLSPQLCWLEWTKNKWSYFVNKVFSTTQAIKLLWSSQLFLRAFYMRKTNTINYRNVWDIPVFTKAYHWLPRPLLQYFCLISCLALSYPARCWLFPGRRALKRADSLYIQSRQNIKMSDKGSPALEECTSALAW